MKTKPTLLLSLTFLFLFSSGVSGETKKFNIATGTGFFLGSSNYIVTNYHVIHGAKQIQVKLVNGEILVAEVALKNPEENKNKKVRTIRYVSLVFISSFNPLSPKSKLHFLILFQ